MRRFAVTFARLMLRTANTPLSAVWALAYWSVIRAAVAWVRRQYREASIYVKGSFASREEVYGISDVDLIVVLPLDATRQGSAQLRARESWKKLCQRFPLFRVVIQHCWFYEEDDLRDSLSAPCLTYGLASSHYGEGDDRAAFLGPHPLHDHMGLQTYPSLYGARGEWQSLGGRDRIPPVGPDDPQTRRLTAWLHLQYWWRYAFLACAEPARDYVPLLCVKLIAEPVRLWLWVSRGERVATREAALRCGLSELPEERAVLQLGLDLLKALPRSPHPPLPEVIAALLRHTERLALEMSAAADAAGFVDVRLTGCKELTVTPEVVDRMHTLTARGESGELLPLADWRARAVPSVPDEAIMLIPANAVDAAFLAATASADGGDAIPAFRHSSMLVMPTTNPERGMLRAVQCQPTDPVSMALADGRTVARFPELAGWSAVHCARRAVAEHRGWLAANGDVYPPHGWVGIQRGCSEPTMRNMGLLFTAARAALFLESIDEGRPELAVTVAGVADCLVARDSSFSDVVHSALHDFRASRAAGSNDANQVAALLDIVRNLSAYAGSSALSPA
ncbi:MAG: hypothetical protein M3O61_09450, partial [Gemmatimonadota bacterium]|nr:hypothetical protein [Gemmatimonadota bacterium]